MRLAGVVLLSAGLGGCDTELDNDREAFSQAVPAVVNSAPPANGPAPAKQSKSLKNDDISGSRDTHPAPSQVKSAPDYRAIGTEPFWAVTVRGDAATLERPDHPPVRFAVARHVEERVIRYSGDGFAMTISEGPCSDGMSDALWRDRVAVAFVDGVLKGCGGERDERAP
nr:membrane-like protein [Sphingobium sp. AS12]